MKDNGRYEASFHIAHAFFPILIGKKGTTKKRVEQETKARINIPRQGASDDAPVTVQADSRQAVASAWSRMHVMVEAARAKQVRQKYIYRRLSITTSSFKEFTHFLSIPINTAEMRSAFASFRGEVLEDCGDERGVDCTVFQHEGMLHLTIGTMALMGEIT